MKPYELIGHHAVLRLADTSDLFALARAARAIVDEHPDELRHRIIVVETLSTSSQLRLWLRGITDVRWYWLGRAASFHPVRIAANNLTDAIERSGPQTFHAEVPMTGNHRTVAVLVLALFAVIAGPAIFKFFT